MQKKDNTVYDKSEDLKKADLDKSALHIFRIVSGINDSLIFCKRLINSKLKAQQ